MQTSSIYKKASFFPLYLQNQAAHLLELLVKYINKHD